MLRTKIRVPHTAPHVRVPQLLQQFRTLLLLSTLVRICITYVVISSSTYFWAIK